MTVSNPLRVLVVEDEYFQADDLKKALNREGMTVIGPVSSAADAMSLLDDATIDCAILDINLRGCMVYPLARMLKDRDVPFLFVTGYESAELDSGFVDVELIQKPFAAQDVIRSVRKLARGDEWGTRTESHLG